MRSALEETSRSASQLSEINSLDDLMALNSRLAGAQLERMADLWSGMWRAAGEAQKSMIESYAFTTRARPKTLRAWRPRRSPA